MATFILTWNPKEFPWDDEGRPEEARTTASGRLVRGAWSTGTRTKGINPGEDRAFILKQGKEPRGIVASGVFLSEPEPGNHFSKPGKKANYADISWDRILEDEEILLLDVVKSKIPEVNWDRIQGGGVELHEPGRTELERLWAMHTDMPIESDDAISDERKVRKRMWEQLLEAGGPKGVEPKLLRRIGIYGGAQGIWVDKARTRTLTEDGNGITVGLLHTGVHYDDDWSESDVLYHYPETDRVAGRDSAEVEATKACKYHRLPVFVIHKRGSVRDVSIGWVEDWDDDQKEFLVTFGDDPQSPPPQHVIEPFVLHGKARTKKQREVAARENQNRFKLLVRRRYGSVCAVCPVAVPEVLHAAHIFEVKDGGSDHPGNGLVLCPTHHVAFDAGLFAIDAETTELLYRDGGPSKGELRITRDNLQHLKRLPEPAALKERFDRW